MVQLECTKVQIQSIKIYQGTSRYNHHIFITNQQLYYKTLQNVI